jgi:hypothetical protein
MNRTFRYLLPHDIAPVFVVNRVRLRGHRRPTPLADHLLLVKYEPPLNWLRITLREPLSIYPPAVRYSVE